MRAPLLVAPCEDGGAGWQLKIISVGRDVTNYQRAMDEVRALN